MTRLIPRSIAIFSVAGLIVCPFSNTRPSDLPNSQPKLSSQLIDRLETARSPSEEDKIIAARDPRIPAAEFRTQFLKHIYDVILRGEYSRAAADCQRVLRLAIAAARVHLGYILRESGDLAGSLDAINQALDFYTAHPEFIHGLIAAQQSRGITYLKQSDFAHALESFERALALSEKIGDRDGIIPALNSIGEVYASQGQAERALEYYGRARRQVGDDDAWNMAFIFNNIGMSYDALGDFDRAIENIERARKVAERVNFQPRVENSIAILGDLELKRGRPEQAREDYAQSLRLARELRDVSGAAQATLGLAQVAQVEGDAKTAFARSQEAAELFRKVGERVSLAAALTLNGRSLCTLRRDDEARTVFETAISAIEETRGEVAGGDVEREQFFAHEIAPYQELASLFVRQAKTEQAVSVAAGDARLFRECLHRDPWQKYLRGLQQSCRCDCPKRARAWRLSDLSIHMKIEREMV
ncbi:MAG TPA: tetratricopeptide repeat protein [Chthoniobacterales bacterium]|jgi:tetratricopeptide (TPR) repeat protein